MVICLKADPSGFHHIHRRGKGDRVTGILAHLAINKNMLLDIFFGGEFWDIVEFQTFCDPGLN